MAGWVNIIRKAAKAAGQSASACVWQAAAERTEFDEKKKGKEKAGT